MEVSQAITRKSASNLALAFILLPAEKRLAMQALYAFCREVDDVADDEAVSVPERRAQLARWDADIQTACAGGQPHFPVNQELRPFIAQYRLPLALFQELIRGVEMDLDLQRYETCEALEQYCYRVASVVGLLSIEIFGYRNSACRDYAVSLGKALQLTNILRDVAEDAERGRIYLPLTELVRFNVRPEEILRGEYSERYAALARSVAARAREFYRLAHASLPDTERRAMMTAELMGSVYWRLLVKLERKNFNVFTTPRTRLNKPQKILLILRTWFRLTTGALSPNYGLP